jgi:hypothetical protein
MIREGIKIEVGITNLDILSQVENEKTSKYYLMANTLIYKCKVKIIPYAMTWEGLLRISTRTVEMKSGLLLRLKHMLNAEIQECFEVYPLKKEGLFLMV